MSQIHGRLKNNRLFKLLFFLWLFFGLVGPLALPINDAAAQNLAGTITQSSLLNAVERARLLLRQQLVQSELSKKEEIYFPKKEGVFDVTLAVWSRVNDSITLIRGIKNGKELDLITDFNVPIRIEFDNGVNTYYAVGGSNHVVGVIHPVFQEVTVKKRKMYRLQDVIYVPYSPGFYLPEVLGTGSDYLSRTIDEAFQDLRAKKVKSVAFKGKLLADVIDPYLVKSIAIIEHSDDRIFNDENPEIAFGRFLILLALNRGDAYNFSVSRAGARGLVQFIPSTYQRLLKRRPDIDLTTDFTLAMTDHHNAIKAQIALLDVQITELPRNVRELVQTHPAQAAEIMAASYNGGTPRVRKALLALGSNWSVRSKKEIESLQGRVGQIRYEISQLKKGIAHATTKEVRSIKLQISKLEQERDKAVQKTGVLSKRALRPETAMYVVKLRRVYQMLLAGYFAPPPPPVAQVPAEPPIQEAVAVTEMPMPQALAAGPDEILVPTTQSP